MNHLFLEGGQCKDGLNSPERFLKSHGRTAIKLSVPNMPRLSVDIYLTCLPIADRKTSLCNNGEAFESVQGRIENIISPGRVQHKNEIAKLQISSKGAEIKLEVNLVGRDSIKEPVKCALRKSSGRI